MGDTLNGHADIDISLGAGGFPFDTPVITERGPIAIGRLVERQHALRVLGYDADRHCLEWKSLVGWFCLERAEPFVRIRYEGGDLVCAASQSFWTVEHGQVAASGLVVGQRLLRTDVHAAVFESACAEDLRGPAAQAIADTPSWLRLKADAPRMSPREHKACAIGARVIGVDVLETPKRTQRLPSPVYSLRVGDTHNCFAAGVLVSMNLVSHDDNDYLASATGLCV